MASASELSSRNSNSETELYSDILFVQDGIEVEVLERGIETDPYGKV